MKYNPIIINEVSLIAIVIVDINHVLENLQPQCSQVVNYNKEYIQSFLINTVLKKKRTFTIVLCLLSCLIFSAVSDRCISAGRRETGNHIAFRPQGRSCTVDENKLQ